MKWSMLLNYTVWVDIVIPLVSALIGGFVTMWGVLLTIKREQKNSQEQAVQAAKPWIFSLNPLEDYDYKNACDVIMSGSAQVGKNAMLQFIIKNTDNGLGIIEKFQTEKNTYTPKVGRILDKNSITHLKIILDLDETLQDMYLYVKDIYGNCYKYRAVQKGRDNGGNHIEEIEYIPASKKRGKKR